MDIDSEKLDFYRRKNGIILDMRKAQLPVVLHVKTSRLWQSPRSYIWKHLGNSAWTIQDGVKVTLYRIH